jgi:dolichyl-phosphate beta-glucosyltransferase
MDISVVIPAYNEEKRITPTIDSVIAYLEREYPQKYEVIIVIDGSQDNTLGVVNNLQKQYSTIRIIANQINQGKGAVVKQGILASKGKYVLFMDADNSTHIEELDAIIPMFQKGIPIVIGSRDLAQSKVKVHQSWWKELLGDIGNIWIQTLLVGGIKDTQCGFKVFEGDVARLLFTHMSMTGWSFDIELLALARANRYEVYEAPIVWYNDDNSHVKLSGYFKVLLDTIIIRYRLWKGYYS